jgi:hypothetical protein
LPVFFSDKEIMMGVKLRNLSILCDYATPEKYTALELHMELPIPHQDIAQVQGWLGEGNWHASADYLANKYPQHRGVIHEWMEASQARSEGRHALVSLAA